MERSSFMEQREPRMTRSVGSSRATAFQARNDAAAERKKLNTAPEKNKKSFMFGDIFGTKASYDKGIFYSGRQKYLQEDVHLPPPELMTLSHTKRLIKANKQTIWTKKFEFKKEEPPKPSNRVNTILRKANRGPELITIERFSSHRRSDWTEMVQAGCRIWVNKGTGEVSDQNPFLFIDSDSESIISEGTNSASHLAPAQSGMFLTPSQLTMNRSALSEEGSLCEDSLVTEGEDQTERGTGSLVYDGTAINEILSILENSHGNSRK